ncbi:uncharacterized protein SCHCODRAFT_02607525 [Schizophyllum commune H4-8]|nr:uncharacterized protein SCHCODRAFT_02607525 [Schizophyllum commune H4-8]KAI5900286.1 hypothetical protein SCHCODRAFT_02607525 [Schizophyllum commune H4-8]
MAPKRKRRDEQKGLAPGQVLKRAKLLGNASSPWGWVGTDVLDATHITDEHRLAACGFNQPLCANKYAPEYRQMQKERQRRAKERKTREKRDSSPAGGADEVIVISDTEEAQPDCSKKLCNKCNPNCLNYLGQDQWEDEDDAWEAFRKRVKLGDSPLDDARDPDLPVGLYNLGATCYANASLQVWFRDLAFRRGVYNCQPCGNESEDKFKQSPLFHLQVTFTALQESTQSVFNPNKLVESLQLRTSEQQDAQEFSKLFMTHLASEFNKQSIPSVRSLVADQFEGVQLYGTRCDTCKTQSERESTFLEIEVNFGNNSRLEDCVASSLQPEKLTGDNKYACSACNALRDATRYTKLRKLPPVLHFSLMRFVYDLKTYERKKSKSAIVFPTVLDMGRFVEGGGDASGSKAPAAANKESPTATGKESHIYDLRGVLLHKGSSAYHGHYEAQVYDTERACWFQFNDEIVTKITTLQEKNSKPIVVDVEGEDEKPKKRPNVRKRRRVEDSEDEADLLSPTATSKAQLSATAAAKAQLKSTDITSKDAYMLIYARRETPAILQASGGAVVPQANGGTTVTRANGSTAAMNGQTAGAANGAQVNGTVGFAAGDAATSASASVAVGPKPTIANGNRAPTNGDGLSMNGSAADTASSTALTPPARAMEAVAALNAKHSEECERYLAKESEVKSAFRELRRKVMDIYQSWSVSRQDEPSVVVSSAALSEWLSTYSATAEVRRLKPIVKAMKEENRAAQRADSVSGKVNGMDGETKGTPAKANGGVVSTSDTNADANGTKVGTNGNTGIEDDGATSSDAMDVDAKPSVNGEAESKPLDKGKQKAVDEPSDDGDPNEIIHISIADDLLCEHGELHPSNSTSMKRIRKDAYDKIAAQTRCVFVPLLTPQDVCRQCVEVIFKDRLYQVEHPRLVSQFDDIAEVPEGQPGYWISKPWVKDWRLTKPKMHRPDTGDPAPDSDEFKDHVLCEHGRLINNIANRRRISLEAGNLLQALFPGLQLLPASEEPCAICAVAIHSSKEGRLEARKKAEDEKARLKHMLDHALNGDTALLEDTPLAIVPSQFVRAWKMWLGRPTEYPRPPGIDNSSFFCEHDQLAFDPNVPADMDSKLAVIKRSDWEVLQTLYPCGPLIALEKEAKEKRYRHDIPVCVDCRQRRKSDWESTDITIRVGGPDKAKPTTTKKTYGSRQSKRLRSVKEQGERRKMSVTKQTSIMGLKIMIQSELSIPTICQRLFYQGKELDDNKATMESLGIFANDTIDLREEQEKDSFSDTEDGEHAAKRQRSEERGFGGTLLGAAVLPSSELPTPPPDMKSCPHCTFFNAREAEVCETCDGALL